MPILQRTTLRKLLERVVDKVERGDMTLHNQGVYISQLLKEAGVPNQMIWEELCNARDKVTARRLSDKELMDSLTWKSSKTDGARSYERQDKVTRKCQHAIDTWASRGCVKQLISSSDSIPTNPQEILEDMYLPDENLFIHESIGHGQIKTCKDWCSSDLSKMQYICQSILRDPQAGRNNANVEKQRWYVFETDDLPKLWDEQAGLIVRLSQELPLKMVVYSGSKSLHSFFKGNVPRKDKVTRWFEMAKTLGGDSQVLDVRCQLVRFPWGINTKTNNQQKVIFYRYG